MDKALYPGAVIDLLPEAYGQAPIDPDGACYHRFGFDGTAAAVRRHFGRAEIQVESHFAIALDGTVLQFVPVDRRADAQAKGNRYWRDGRWRGLVSIEHQDAGHTALTKEQVEADVALLRWLYLDWGIPMNRARVWDGGGIGYHAQFVQWNPNRHSCFADKRVAQLYDEIVPRARQEAGPLLQIPHFPGVTMRAVDAVQAPNGGSWVADITGKVECFHGAPHYGDYTTIPAEHRNITRLCVGLDPTPDGKGYETVMAGGRPDLERYTFHPEI